MLRLTPETPFVVQKNIRYCMACKHARKLNYTYKEEIGCALYKNIDLISGNVMYDSALDVRKDEQKCGIQGHYFSPIGAHEYYANMKDGNAKEDENINENKDEIDENNSENNNDNNSENDWNKNEKYCVEDSCEF